MTEPETWRRRAGILGLLCGMAISGCAGEESTAVFVESVTGMEFVRIPAGEFAMGSASDVVGRESQEVQHRVWLSQPFYLGRNEVTQAAWQTVMGSNPSQFEECGADCPVENISWHDAHEFIRRLGKISGEKFRLPTESEWEWACRAGTATPFSTGETLTADLANFDGRYPYAGTPPSEYRARSTRVGSFPPNPWGLNDMHGNMWEWCEDDHCPYPNGPVTDPVGKCESGLKVIRGGSWYFDANSARSALRYTHRPQDVGPSLGLRLVWVSSGLIGA